MELILFRKNNDLILGGVVKEIKNGVSAKGNPFVTLKIEGSAFDEEMQMDLDKEMDVTFTDNEHISWTERIEAMKIAEGAAVFIQGREVAPAEGSNYAPSVYGSAITYASGRGHVFTIRGKDETEKDVKIILGKAKYAEKDDSKGTASIAVSVMAYNKDTKENYWCNYKLKVKDNKEKNITKAKPLYDAFIGPRDAKGKFGVFETYGDPFVSDKQKDAEHPTVVHYTLNSWKMYELPEKPTTAN